MGVSGTAGEFGYTIIDYNGPECYCGNRGCIESYAVTVAKRIGMLLGIDMANAINLYNPGAVIVGGELCEVPLCTEAAFEEAKRHIFRNVSRDVNFLISSRDNPMLIMGTIAYAMENYFNEYCKC